MEDQFELGDLRQYMNGRPHFPGVPPSGDIFSGHRNLTQAQHYEMVMVGTRQMSEIVPHGLQDQQFRSDCTTPSVTCTSTAGSLNGLETEVVGGLGGGDGGTGRWPRQETLTLLEIRSRLDSKFKEANQKGPLWDEVSRILSEEHGYQRSGKKCREKFENLYKYYKKTKEGKAGRQDGKNYRFFRQLEALYGETSNTVPISETHLVGNSFRFHNSINNSNSQPNQETFQAPKLSESLSLTSSSEFNSSSSDDNDVNESTEKMKKRRGRRSWKGKIRDFIESQMRKLMEKQEAWLEKMMKTIERKEQERMIREEEWRKQEKARVDGEHKFWANERAWIEARDSALMKALQKFTEKEGLKLASNAIENGNETISSTLERDSWVECEITRLIQLRTSMESRFEQGGCSEEALWDEIAAKMACLGYDRTGSMCKEKWDTINIFLRQTNKKRKENSRSCYFENNDLLYNQQGGTYGEINQQGSENTRSIATNGGDLPTNSNGGGNVMNDSCFRLYMGDGENLWENYGMKLSKGEDH